MKVNLILAVATIVFFSSPAFSESKIENISATTTKNGHTMIIRNIDDAKEYASAVKTEQSVRARPIFEDLNMDHNDSKAHRKSKAVSPDGYFARNKISSAIK